MGVPALYGWLARTFGQDFVRKQFGSSKNVYIDMNSVIHPCCHSDSGPLKASQQEMFESIARELEKLVKLSQPQELLFLAIDGVAPAAKMGQQRERRLRAVTEEDERRLVEMRVRKDKELLGEPMPPRPLFERSGEDDFDKNNITPGTQFMVDLSAYLQQFVARRLSSNDPVWRNLNVIISDAQVPGEGEHKILDFIRSQPEDAPLRRQEAAPTKRKPQSAGDTEDELGADVEGALAATAPEFSHMIIGDDADLAVLGLALQRPNVGVLRNMSRLEVMLQTSLARRMKLPPRFLVDYMEEKKLRHGQGRASYEEKDAQRLKQVTQHKEHQRRAGASLLTGVEYAAIDIDELRRGIHDTLRPSLRSEADFPRALTDVVVMFTLGGNDFLPHMPTLDVRNDGLGVLLDVYKTAVLLPAKASGAAPQFIVDEDLSVNREALEHFLLDYCSVEEHLQAGGPARAEGGDKLVHQRRPGRGSRSADEAVTRDAAELVGSPTLEDVDLALTLHRRARTQRAKQWRPPRSMVECRLDRDPVTRLCARGNRCDNLHDTFVPRDYALQRIRSSVLAFTLQATERYLAGDNRFEKLPPFADASFAFTDGPQRGVLVADARHEKQLTLTLSGLDGVERTQVRALGMALGLHVSWQKETGEVAGSDDKDDGSQLKRGNSPRNGPSTHQRHRGGQRGKAPDNLAPVGPVLLSMPGRQTDWHADGIPARFKAAAIRARRLLADAYAEEVDHALVQHIDAVTAAANASDEQALGGSGRGNGGRGWSDGPGSSSIVPQLYYMEKLDVDMSSPAGEARVREMAVDYLRGLQFVARYYLAGVPSWDWQYTHHYAPFGRDLLAALPAAFAGGSLDKWQPSEPVSPVQQLLSVLPARSARAVPSSARSLMEAADSPVAQFYPDPEDVLLDPNGRRFRWQWVAVLPSLDPTQLHAELNRTRASWTPAERVRDEVRQPVLLSATRPSQAPREARGRGGQVLASPLAGADAGLPFRAQVLQSRVVGKVTVADVALGNPAQGQQRRALFSAASALRRCVLRR